MCTSFGFRNKNPCQLQWPWYWANLHGFYPGRLVQLPTGSPLESHRGSLGVRRHGAEKNEKKKRLRGPGQVVTKKSERSWSGLMYIMYICILLYFLGHIYLFRQTAKLYVYIYIPKHISMYMCICIRYKAREIYIYIRVGWFYCLDRLRNSSCWSRWPREWGITYRVPSLGELNYMPVIGSSHLGHQVS